MKKLAYKFDPFELTGLERPTNKSDVKRALNEIADYVRTEVLQYVGDGSSPVSGGAWKKTLSPEYKKIKEKISSAGFANLELTGDMLDALECVVTKDGELSLQIVGSEAPKADGHNNFSGKSELPAREFIPNEKKSQTFKRPILQGMKEIARSFLNDDE